MELSSHLLRGFRNIGCFIIWLCSQNHFLNVLPCQIFTGETFIIFFLGLVELQEQYSNEEIEEEDESELNFLMAGRINRLAALFYQSNGRVFDAEIDFRNASHPEERGCWNKAIIAFSFVNNDTTLLRHQVR